MSKEKIKVFPSGRAIQDKKAFYTSEKVQSILKNLRMLNT